MENKDTYSQMEKRMDEIIESINKTDSLDEQIKLFKEGKTLIDKMKKELDRLQKLTEELEIVD